MTQWTYLTYVHAYYYSTEGAYIFISTYYAYFCSYYAYIVHYLVC